MPDVADWRTLHDDDGELIARYLHTQRGTADLLELAVPVERALPVVQRELRGMRVAGPVELGRALVADGAQPLRHAHVLSHALTDLPAEPAGLFPLDRPAADLVAAYEAAFPPAHPDRSEPVLPYLEQTIAMGLLDASGVAVDGDAVVGAILVSELHEVGPPLGGPWVMEVFRDPRYPGVGRALLERALARVEGPALGLTVTEGNPARRLYERLGFRRVLTAFTVQL
jgi:ribosomal protein S18 acetylase RimI-like enzyme